MTPRERFLAVLHGEKPDRLPMIEWASWWEKTIDRWKEDGLPNLNWGEITDYFGLEHISNIGSGPYTPPAPYHGGAVIKDEADYERIRDEVFSPDIIERLLNSARNVKARHDAGEIIIRVWLDGFFWFPRRLFGIEPHFYAFYDYPELMHRMTRDLRDFNMRMLEELFKFFKPEYIAYAEDMSYNHGPMLSRELFDEFIKPHYLVLTAFARENGVVSMLDSDGDMTSMIPWFLDSGIDAICPLERQANVDASYIRQEYPDLIMLGGYDKMVMNKGEVAMRAEFERLLPVMKSGRYIPSVDHQTPPGVSLEDYKLYVKLLKEYCEKAVR
jgi:hypothetical protein